MDDGSFNWKPWQKTIIDSANIFDARGVDVIYGPIDNVGKEMVKAYICGSGVGKAIPVTNNYKNIMRTVISHEGERHYNIYFLDPPKTTKVNDMRNFYSAIKTIKDGYAFDTRYKFKEITFDSPRVWVMTDSLPDMSLLSKDRWRIWIIKDGSLEPYNAMTAK